MDVYEAIEKRRSIRIFREGVSEEKLREIILAGTKAPSAANRQPWEFIIIDDGKLVDQLAELKYQQNRRIAPREGETQHHVEKKALFQKRSFENASIVAVCNKKDQAPSAWLCVENMSLAAVADELGSCIVSYWGEYRKEAEEILGIPEGYELTCVMKFGVPGEEGFPRDKNPSAPRRPEFSWLHKNRF
jgi:nitroreductase